MFVIQGIAVAGAALLSPTVMSPFLKELRVALADPSAPAPPDPSRVSFLWLMSLIALVPIASWAGRACGEARAAGREMAHSPRMAPLSWFIPVVRWWFPYQVVRDLFPMGAEARATARVWWALWLGGRVLTAALVAVAFWVPPGDVTPITVVPAGMAVAAGILGRRLVLTANRAGEAGFG